MCSAYIFILLFGAKKGQTKLPSAAKKICSDNSNFAILNVLILFLHFVLAQNVLVTNDNDFIN